MSSTPDWATASGVRADCPFCLARKNGRPNNGELVLVLSGPDAGQEGRFAERTISGRTVDILETDPGDANEMRILSLERELVGTLGNLRCPRWLPPFELARVSKIEASAWLFCQSSFVGDQFQWSDVRAANLVHYLWTGRIDLKATELSALLLAHGLPSALQRKIERFYEIGQRCLVAEKNKPVKSWRNREAIAETFTDAMRYSYRW